MSYAQKKRFSFGFPIRDRISVNLKKPPDITPRPSDIHHQQ